LSTRVLALLLLLTSLLVSGSEYAGIAFASPHGLISAGSRGREVRDAQERLRAWGFYDGPVDGVFGPRTAAAVRWFQRQNGLTVDGAVGPETWRAMGIAPDAAPAARGRGGDARGANVDMLARLVRAEAEAEPYEGKVAVAAVILNRIRDSRFPNTLEGVMYQPWAFEAVHNGRIYQTPPRSDDRRAARDAMNGWDPTHGAVFFWNPNKPVTPWIWSRPIVKRIGNHVFAR
jgi:N-acetylmuramoyl-L-alanine amidase